MKRYLRHPVVQNALALYSVQIAEYVIPMVTLPYVARILQPTAYGMVVYTQSFAYWMILVLEYGFSFSATREIARHRDNPDHHAEVVRGVVGANIILLLPCILIALVARFTVPPFREHPWFLWLAVAIALPQGMKPFWYYLGIEQVKFPAWFNVFVRLCAAVGIFLIVKSPAHAWRVLALQATMGGVVTWVLAARMYRKVPFRWPTLKNGMTALRAGWTIFLSGGAVSLYTTANTFILGLVATSAAVAYFGGAERIVQIIIGLMGPFSQAIYPRMVHLAANDRHKLMDTIRLALILFGVVGVVAASALILTAPLVIRIVFGPSYKPAVAVLRVASLIIPMVAVTNIVGVQWMLPFHMDRVFNRIVVCAGVLNVTLALILAPRFGPLGTAWSVVVSQGFVATCMFTTLLRARGKAAAQSAESPAAE